MGKQKKITTLDLLEQMANKNQETSSTLEQLKLDRMGLKQQTTSLNVRKEDAINKLEKNRKPKEDSPSEMGVKTSRNDLIRKVLLDFTNRNYEKLITLIEQK